MIIDKASFYNKNKSVFLLLSHDNNYIQNIDVLLSPDIIIATKEKHKIIEISRNFMRLNHHLDISSFIIDLIDIRKKSDSQSNWSLFHFLKRNTGILFQIEGSLILFDFIMSETQLFKEDYHS